jgi:hypothetical protein
MADECDEPGSEGVANRKMVLFWLKSKYRIFERAKKWMSKTRRANKKVDRRRRRRKKMRAKCKEEDRKSFDTNPEFG